MTKNILICSMHLLNKIPVFLLFFLTSFVTYAQEKGKTELVPLETFKIEAKVISTLEGRNDLAVLQMINTDKNPWDLKAKDEILATFLYTTKKTREFSGVKAGDTILADLYGKLNSNTIQVDYTILRYRIATEPIKSREAP